MAEFAHDVDEVHPPRRTRRLLVLLLLCTAPILFTGLANHGYWLSDEPFVAEISREMLASGDYVVPRLNGEPFLEKPPLHYALVAVAYRAFGVTPFAARLPSALAALVTIVATFYLGKRLFGARVGFAGAFFVASTFSFFCTSHYCLVDATLSAFVALGFLCGAYAFGPDRRSWAIPLAYVCAAGAFLAKGPVGPILLGAGLAAFALCSGERRFFARREHVAGLGLFALLVGPWIVALERAGGAAFVKEALVANTFGRFFTIPSLVPADDSLGEHVEPWHFYFPKLMGGFMPWSPLLVLAAGSALLELKRGRRSAPEIAPLAARLARPRTYLWACALAGFAILSASSTKRNVYVLPLYPLFALACAQRLQETASARSIARIFERASFAVQAAVACVISFAAAVGTVLLSGPAFGEPPQSGFPALASALALAACAGAWITWRAFVAERRAQFVATTQVMCGASMVVFSVACLPFLESERGFTPFFERCVHTERARETTPLLFMRQESYTGYAGLYFGVLARLDLEHGTREACRGERSVDVITDEHGLGELRALSDASVAMLEEHHQRRMDGSHALYLVELAPLGVELAPLGVELAPLGVELAPLEVELAPLGPQDDAAVDESSVASANLKRSKRAKRRPAR